MAGKNWAYIVQGEISLLLPEMKRSVRYPSLSVYQDDNPLINNFTQLRETLHGINDLYEVEPSTIVSPFLEIIRSEETSGRITGLALTSLTKFISYGLIDMGSQNCAQAVESIADAVTHARFVGTDDPESDEVVLMKILHVLRTLLLSPPGCKLTNESVCEIMQSCFRICFEMRLSKLLRKSADHTLVDMIQHLFLRLPEFKEDGKWASSMKKLKMRAGGLQKPHRKKDRRVYGDEHSSRERTDSENMDTTHSEQVFDQTQSAPSTTPQTQPKSTEENEHQEGHYSTERTEENETLDDDQQLDDESSPVADVLEGFDMGRQLSSPAPEDDVNEDTTEAQVEDQPEQKETLDFINPKGVRFVPKKDGPIVSYGLPCIRELFRFLISIMNPSDKHNSDTMTHMGISLLTVALETAADHFPNYSSLMSLVKNELCFNLFRQLQTDKLGLFAPTLRACFLLFEAMRSHLKYQLEMYLTKLMDIIVSDSIRITYDVKEIALEAIVQLWRIPGLVAELYLNYDCDVFCSNLFEDITKLLSKNAFPVQGLFSTHILSLDALLTVLDSVESHCHVRILAANKSEEKEKKGAIKKMQVKPNRMVVSDSMPTPEQLHSRKHRKQIMNQGVDQFNQKPKQGIAFLQENGILTNENESIVKYLRETPKLSKTMIGEYISRKNNPTLTDAYVRSFNFTNKRIDQSLRMFLESFRLPGESPVIEFLVEHFSKHWFESNDAPFANVDAAFTLTYAVIMLNVDQHNQNAKKQNIPMTVEQFKKNVKFVNGNKDFDQVMLEEIFDAIHTDEIVMPEEQTGAVRENYLWKMLLKKDANPVDSFVHVPTGCYDNDIFTIIWGPTIAALSFVFDKSQNSNIVQKAITGFRKCAMISAHYGLSEVFDNLVISLCKFTTFLNSSEGSEQIPLSFAANNKAQLAAKTVFNLAHRHGDMLREGWKNILDCMLTLYRAKLLPPAFTEVEDFLHEEGKINIIREDKSGEMKNDSGVFGAFYTFFGTDSSNQKTSSPEETQAMAIAKELIEQCDLDSVIDDTKFLRTSSLQELIKALISLCQISEMDGEGCQDEDTVVFFLELLIRVVLQNRDRAGAIWQNVREHLSSIILQANDHTFLTERAVTGLIRLANRLLCREEIAAQVLPSLRVLLLMKTSVLRSMARQLAYGLHLLLETNAANIHSKQDWYYLFTLLEAVGAGGNIPSSVSMNHAGAENGAQSDNEINTATTDIDSERGCTSDSELYEHQRRAPQLSSSSTNLSVKPAPDNWLMVHKMSKQNTSLDGLPTQQKKVPSNQFSITLGEELQPHDTQALMKSADILTLLVRDAAHITPYNFDSCVHAIRVFVEASMCNQQTAKKKSTGHKDKKHKKKDHGRKAKGHGSNKHGHHSDDEDTEKINRSYQKLSLQLLELMHTLHTQAAKIYHSWAMEQNSVEGAVRDIDDKISTLWIECWCPLLQGIARLCSDSRGQNVRSQALTYLTSALLVQDLNKLSAVEWEACFNKVLFPLLTILLEKTDSGTVGLEETRSRASSLLSKVFLQHLQLLSSLSTFTALWLTILDFMDKYMHADNSGQLMEAIPEILTNMLRVMNTTGDSIFMTGDSRMETKLWGLTCDRLDTFLPQLKRELFSPALENERRAQTSSPVLQEADNSTLSSSSDVPVTASNAQPSSQISNDRIPSPTLPLQQPQQQPQATSHEQPPQQLHQPQLQQPLRRPDSPENSPRSNSPLVYNMPKFTPVVQLHPPLAPTHKPAPTLLPVNTPYNALPRANALFGGMPAANGEEARSILLNPDIMRGSSITTLQTQQQTDDNQGK